MKEEVSIRLVSQESDLPHMTCKNFFHSVELFRIAEATPMQEPCMAIAEDGRGNVVGHMLTTIFYHRSIIPPALYSHGRVYGEGEYADESDKDALFALFVEKVTTRFNHRLCLYIEFSDLSNKMFGYATFRANGYFPIQWQEIHNSLHSMSPSKRITDKLQDKIDDGLRRGVTMSVAQTDSDDLRQAIQLLRNHFRFKPRRSVPHNEMFERLAKSDNCKILVTKYKNKVIGTSVCVYSEQNAYVWYMASLRKSYIALHPATCTIWAALTYAHQAEMRHVYFIDAGLPFKHSPQRDFILSFGGKPVTKYRWFRTPLQWLDHILDWMYNE